MVSGAAKNWAACHSVSLFLVLVVMMLYYQKNRLGCQVSAQNQEMAKKLHKNQGKQAKG
jgi:hypothetical protein